MSSETAAPVASTQAAPAAPVVAQSPAPGGEGDETFDGEEGLTLRALVSSKEAGELEVSPFSLCWLALSGCEGGEWEGRGGVGGEVEDVLGVVLVRRRGRGHVLGRAERAGRTHDSRSRLPQHARLSVETCDNGG